MPITDQGIKIELPENLVPENFAPPAYTEISDFEYKREYTLTVLKSTVQNAAKETTFSNIINDVAIGILKQINDLVVADFIGTNQVDYYSIFKDIQSNVVRSLNSQFYTDTAFSFVCKVEVYIKTT
jgi:choline kinase